MAVSPGYGDLAEWPDHEDHVPAELSEPLARSLRDSRASLTYRWLQRIDDRLDVGPNDVFPTEELLDHVPLLVEAIADFIEHPSEEGPTADEVVAKATELGAMRFEQGYSTYQVLKEFEILGGVLLSFLRNRVPTLGFTPDPTHVITMAHRLYRAVAKVQQVTAGRHITMLEQQRREMDQRLRLVRHRLGELTYSDGGDGARDGGADALSRRLKERLEELRELTGTSFSTRRRGIPLVSAVGEAVRHVRDIARDAGVSIRLSDSLPSVTVSDVEVEHCLLAYLTRAIRHCSPAGEQCFIEVRGELVSEAGEVVVTVRNTGERVQATDDVTRTGSDSAAGGGEIGMTLARDLVAGLGGRTWSEPARDPDGAIFGFALPSRRGEDGEDAPD